MGARVGPFACLGLGLSTCMAIFLALAVLPAGLGGLALWPFIGLGWAAINRLIVFTSERSEVDFEVWKQRRRDAGIPVPEDLLQSSRVLQGPAFERNQREISRILAQGERGSPGSGPDSAVRTTSGGGEFDPDARDFADFLRSGPF